MTGTLYIAQVVTLDGVCFTLYRYDQSKALLGLDKREEGRKKGSFTSLSTDKVISRRDRIP